MNDLAEHGLSWVEPPVRYSHPLDHGRGAAAYRSIEETGRHLGGRDGRTWTRVCGSLNDRFDTIADEFLQGVLHIPRHPLHLGRFGLYAGQPASLLADAGTGSRPALCLGLGERIGDDPLRPVDERGGAPYLFRSRPRLVAGPGCGRRAGE